MSDSLVQCQNPEVCGVNMHKSGSASHSRCIATSTSRDKGSARRRMPEEIRSSIDDEGLSPYNVLLVEDDGFEAMVSALNTDPDRLAEFLDRTEDYMQEDDPQPSDRYLRMYDRLSKNEDIRDSLASYHDVEPEEIEELLRETGDHLGVRDLTREKVEQITPTVRRLSEIQEQMDALGREAEELKSSLRDDPDIPLDQEYVIDGQELYLSEPKVFSKELAESNLSPTEKRQITTRRVDASLARARLSPESLARCQVAGTIRVRIRPAQDD